MLCLKSGKKLQPAARLGGQTCKEFKKKSMRYFHLRQFRGVDNQKGKATVWKTVDRQEAGKLTEQAGSLKVSGNQEKQSKLKKRVKKGKIEGEEVKSLKTPTSQFLSTCTDSQTVKEST